MEFTNIPSVSNPQLFVVPGQSESPSKIVRTNSAVLTSHKGIFSLLSCKDSHDIWIVDTGASDHMTSSNTGFSNYQTCQENIGIIVADGSMCTATGRGDMEINGLNLKSVLHVPNLQCNLLSVSKLTKDLNCSVTFFPFGCKFQDLSSGITIGNAKERNGLYFLSETQQGTFDEILRADLDFSSDPWPSISESAKDLIRKILVRDPQKRLTAHEVLCHPWVQDEGVAPDKPLDPAVLTRLTQFSAMNKLKKMAFRVIAGCLSEEEIAGLKEMFQMLDADNSGQITFDELKAGLKKYGTNLKESEIYDLMRAADVDNNGTIDYGEFIAATLHLNKIEREDRLFAAFSYFDKDGSGYITQDEIQQACEEFGIEDARLEEMMQEVDENKDGHIDYSEFVAMMQNGNADPGKHRLPNSLSSRYREVLPVC